MPAEIFSRAMKSNATNSTTIEMKVPIMMAGDFEPHFSVKHMLKDVRIGMKLAENFGIELPVTQAAGEMLLDEVKNGRAEADYASVAQKYFPVSKPFVRQEPPAKTEPAKTGEELKSIGAIPSETSQLPPKTDAKIEDTRKGDAGATKGEVPEGVNLSGGFRGWFSRFHSSSRREV
jgi:hypothetical protein